MKKASFLSIILLLSSSVLAVTVSLMEVFMSQSLEVDDGLHSIMVPYDGTLPTISINSYLAICSYDMQLNEEQNLVIINITVETENDDGFNGCHVSITQPKGEMATVTLGHNVNM